MPQTEDQEGQKIPGSAVRESSENFQHDTQALFVMEVLGWSTIYFTEDDQVFRQQVNDQLKLKIFAPLQPHFSVLPTVPAIPPSRADVVLLSCLLISLDSHHLAPTDCK